jgi:hypothetical protein
MKKINIIIAPIICLILAFNASSQEIQSLFQGSLNKNHNYLLEEGFIYTKTESTNDELIKLNYQLSDESVYLVYEIFYFLGTDNPPTILLVTSVKEVYDSWFENCKNMEVDEQFTPQKAFQDEDFRYVFDIIRNDDINNVDYTEAYSIQFIRK